MGKQNGDRRPIRTLDLFCSAGGSSWGARLAGAEIVAGFDMCEVAGEAFMRNFPEAWFYEGDLGVIDIVNLTNELGRIDMIIASPECTNHSVAKGSTPRCEASKNTAFYVTQFARAFSPRWVVVENVTNMRNWTRYSDFITQLKSLDYEVTELVLNAEDFGVPQSRRRLFLLCDNERKPSPLVPPSCPPVPASTIIDGNGTYGYSPLRSKTRAAATIERAERAIASVGDQPFLLVYYGTDKAGGWQSLDRPLRTVTTLDRFGFVKRQGSQHVMRMLQVPELKAAMGMPKKFSVKSTSRRRSIRMIGNAVCPPVMREVVKHLVNGGGDT